VLDNDRQRLERLVRQIKMELWVAVIKLAFELVAIVVCIYLIIKILQSIGIL